MRSVESTNQLYGLLSASLRHALRVGMGRDAALIAWMLLAVLSGFLAYTSRLGDITHDVFHEMALVREALAQGEFPRQDVFAFTPTNNPTVHHEWGTGAILYLVTVASGLGLFGLSALRLLLIGALWWLTYRVARLRGAHPVVFAAVAIVIFPVFWVGFSMLRAQLFTLVFIAAQLWMQELDRLGRRRWVIGWWLMLVVWLNMHAGFLVGLGMLGFHCVESFALAWHRRGSFRGALERTWHLGAAIGAVPLALMLNPYGWEYLPYLLRAVRMPRPFILEWQPLWCTFEPEIALPTFACSIALILYSLRNQRWSRWAGAPFLLVCAAETLKHIRHGSIYATVWLAYLPGWLTHTALGRRLIQAAQSWRERTILASQGIAFACFFSACCFQFWRPTLPAMPSQSFTCQPISAVEYLRQNEFKGNLLTQFNEGAYVSWELYPHVKVSLDGRYEVAYPPAVIEDFQRFAIGAAGWAEVLDKYPCDAALIHQEAQIRPKLEVFRHETQLTQQAWRFVYEDDAFVILARKGVDLPYVSRLQEPLSDGAAKLFTQMHAHNHRP